MNLDVRPEVVRRPAGDLVISVPVRRVHHQRVAHGSFSSEVVLWACVEKSEPGPRARHRRQVLSRRAAGAHGEGDVHAAHPPLRRTKRPRPWWTRPAADERRRCYLALSPRLAFT
jgi:hypothetical protein